MQGQHIRGSFYNNHACTAAGATYHFLKTGLSSCVGLEVMKNISEHGNCSTSGRFYLDDLLNMYISGNSVWSTEGLTW